MGVIALMLAALALAPQDGSSRRVESTFDKNADFGALHTYSWSKGSTAFYADADEVIVDAIDAEMIALGFTKEPAGGDVTIAYNTVAITYLDRKTLHRLQRSGAEATRDRMRSTIAVVMRDRASSRQLWTARTREVLDPDPAKLGETIRQVAARLFESYPAPKATRSR